MKIYDLAGKVYFHLGDMQKASYFHQRMMRGQSEPKESAIRIMLLCKLNGRDEKLKQMSIRYAAAGKIDDTKSPVANEPEARGNLFESDEEGEAEMPVSFLTGPAF